MRKPLAAPALALVAVALSTRLHNAFHYPLDWGFDSLFNWRYIARVTQTWTLPAPSLGWSTSDPPLFYYLSGALIRWGGFLQDLAQARIAVRLLGTLAGLAIVVLSVRLVLRVAPGNTRRACLAAGLLLFLPAHIYMSAMVNKELLASFFSALTLFVLCRPAPAAGPRDEATSKGAWQEPAAAGLAAGLSMLTKLTGLLAIATAAATYALRQMHARRLGTGMQQVALVLIVAGLAGGWFYAGNKIVYGYFQPFGMPAHERMFSMPPGQRDWTHYLRVPLATITDPQLLNEDLLTSVWGSSYATIWFDGHRFFLPRDSAAVTRLGSVTLLLALLPTVAFLIGLFGGAGRAWREPHCADPPLLILTALTLAGYAYFAWVNPWFATLKGTSLLSLCLPFAFYGSEVLDRWMSRGRGPALVIASLLLALALACTLSSTFNLAFDKREISGLDWLPEREMRKLTPGAPTELP